MVKPVVGLAAVVRLTVVLTTGEGWEKVMEAWSRRLAASPRDTLTTAEVTLGDWDPQLRGLVA